MPSSPGEYLHYLHARTMLGERLGASPQEIAMWTWLGRNLGDKPAGGIDGYLDPALHDGHPPRFHFMEDTDGRFAYLDQLMKCFYRLDDLHVFEPQDRFITYERVLRRFERFCNPTEAKALFRAKLATGELESMHPQTGATAESNGWGNEAGFPPLEEGMFLLAQVGGIEEELTRQVVAAQLDQQRDPIAWDEAVVDWAYWGRLETLAAIEFAALRNVCDPRKLEAQREVLPDGKSPSLGQRVTDDVRQINADPAVAKKDRLALRQWVQWADRVGLPCPAFIRTHVDQSRPAAPPAAKVGITPKAFKEKHARFVRGGEKYLDKWFKGHSRKKGEIPLGDTFKIIGSYGQYDEEAMVAALKDAGKYSEFPHS